MGKYFSDVVDKAIEELYYCYKKEFHAYTDLFPHEITGGSRPEE